MAAPGTVTSGVRTDVEPEIARSARTALARQRELKIGTVEAL